MNGKLDASGSPALVATVARHLARADPVAREAVLEAIESLTLGPNAETVRAFAERISAVRLNGGARRSVIGAVMNALPRGVLGLAVPVSDGESNGTAQATRKS